VTFTNSDTEYISPTSYEDVVELLVPELQRRGVYWNDYAVPGGTLGENLLGEKGASSVDTAHPGHKFKWNIRETKWPSAWDSRVNALEAAQEANATINGVRVVEGTEESKIEEKPIRPVSIVKCLYLPLEVDSQLVDSAWE
jgi:hypothetical protein